ncbi:hypothetical protein JCM5350_002990 [Sporobolomyces pararoseus]
MSTSATRSLTLPPELKLQILLEDVLSRQDLARICLVDKSWLSCSREVLFQTIKVEICWKYTISPSMETLQWREEEDKAQGGLLSERGFLLLRTLQNDPQLANRVKSIEYGSVWSSQGTEQLFFDAVAAFRKACPEFKSVYFNLPAKVSTSIIQHVLLDVETVTVKFGWVLCADNTDNSDSILSENLLRLKRLECESIKSLEEGTVDNFEPKFPLASLEVLKLHSTFGHFFPASYAPKLRILQLPLVSLVLFKDITHFPALRSLYLTTRPDHSGYRNVDLRILSHHPSLQFLSIENYANADLIQAGLRGLLQQLPPLLTHLVFPSRIPFHILLPLVPSLHSITDLGVSTPLPHEKKKQTNVEELRLSALDLLGSWPLRSPVYRREPTFTSLS